MNPILTTAGQAGGSFLGTIIMLVVMLLFFYIFLIRPQKKKDQEQKEMQSAVTIGDEILTVGGIVGIVVSIAEDSILIETGGNKNKIRVKIWAIHENITKTEAALEAKKEEKKARMKPVATDENQPK
jgi:preprotein translocase subunit YajC